MSSDAVFGLSPAKTRFLIVFLAVSLVAVSLGLGYTVRMNRNLNRQMDDVSYRVSHSLLLNSLSSLSNSYLYVINAEEVTLSDFNTIMFLTDSIRIQSHIMQRLEPEQEELWRKFSQFHGNVYSFVITIEQEVYSVGVVPKESLDLTEEQLIVFMDMRENIHDILRQALTLRTSDGVYNETAVAETIVLLDEFDGLVEEGYRAFNIA